MNHTDLRNNQKLFGAAASTILGISGLIYYGLLRPSPKQMTLTELCDTCPQVCIIVTANRVFALDSKNCTEIIYIIDKNEQNI